MATIRTGTYGKRDASLRPHGRVTGRSGDRRGMDMSMPVRLAVVALGFLLFAGAAGAAIYGISEWLSRSPFFTVTGVTIDGCNRVSEDTVLKLSGVQPNSNLLALDLDDMGHSIEKHPWIKSAAISKKLPDRLEIKITERVPVAIINIDALYLIDSSGTVFKKIKKGEKFDLPVITGVKGILPEQNSTDDRVTAEQIHRILEIIALASRGTRTLGINNISEIHAEGDDIILYTADRGLPMKFRAEASPSIQFRRAEKILHHLYSGGRYKKIAMIDLYYGETTALAKLRN